MEARRSDYDRVGSFSLDLFVSLTPAATFQ